MTNSNTYCWAFLSNQVNLWEWLLKYKEHKFTDFAQLLTTAKAEAVFSLDQFIHIVQIFTLE